MRKSSTRTASIVQIKRNKICHPSIFRWSNSLFKFSFRSIWSSIWSGRIPRRHNVSSSVGPVRKRQSIFNQVRKSIRRFSSLFSVHAIGSFSIIDFAFCQSKLTTHSYSSSGFAILHSTARFHSIDPKTKNLSLSSAIEDFPPSSSSSFAPSPHTRLSSLSTETIANKSMLLLSTSKDRLQSTTTTTSTTVEVNPSKITTNGRSLSTSATFLSNVTSVETAILLTSQGMFYFLLFVACVILGLTLIFLMIYAIIRYRNRDEGTYKIDESHNFVNATCVDQSSKFSTIVQQREKIFSPSPHPHLSDSREWYVWPSTFEFSTDVFVCPCLGVFFFRIKKRIVVKQSCMQGIERRSIIFFRDEKRLGDENVHFSGKRDAHISFRVSGRSISYLWLRSARCKRTVNVIWSSDTERTRANR